jgi:hypothetical protein
MNLKFTTASKSEAFKLVYSLNSKSGFNHPYFVFRKRKNGKFKNKFLKNIEISFKEIVFEGSTGIVMIIKDLIKDEVMMSKYLIRHIETNEEEKTFTIRSFYTLYDERFLYDTPLLDPVSTSNIAYFRNGDDKPFKMDFFFINGDLRFSAYPVGDEFLNVLDDPELSYLQDIEDFHLEYWDKKLDVANNSYLKLGNDEK